LTLSGLAIRGALQILQRNPCDADDFVAREGLARISDHLLASISFEVRA
jgi:hypothetical protein